MDDFYYELPSYVKHVAKPHLTLPASYFAHEGSKPYSGDLNTVVLGRGSHGRGMGRELCVMEYASALSREILTDHPATVSPVIGAYLRALNDGLLSLERQTLRTFAFRALDTNTGANDDEHRRFVILDRVVNKIVPFWFNALGAETDHYVGFRAMPIGNEKELRVVRHELEMFMQRNYIAVVDTSLWSNRSGIDAAMYAIVTTTKSGSPQHAVASLLTNIARWTINQAAERLGYLTFNAVLDLSQMETLKLVDQLCTTSRTAPVREGEGSALSWLDAAVANTQPVGV